MNRWICADLHFGHKNIHKFRTLFSNSREHDNYIIDMWRDTIKGGDLVYILGDIAFNLEGLKKLQWLPGTKHIIVGNHDLPITKLIKYCNIVKAMDCKTIKGKRIIMTHIPIRLPKEDNNRWDYNIHGHVHEYTIDDPKYINVSMEAIDYKPVLLEDLIP